MIHKAQANLIEDYLDKEDYHRYILEAMAKALISKMSDNEIIKVFNISYGQNPYTGVQNIEASIIIPEDGN